MSKDEESVRYGSRVTKEMIEEVFNDIYKSNNKKNRDFKLYVYFNNQEEADKWTDDFNNLLKKEILNKYGE